MYSVCDEQTPLSDCVFPTASHPWCKLFLISNWGFTMTGGFTVHAVSLSENSVCIMSVFSCFSIGREDSRCCISIGGQRFLCLTFWVHLNSLKSTPHILSLRYLRWGGGLVRLLRWRRVEEATLDYWDASSVKITSFTCRPSGSHYRGISMTTQQHTMTIRQQLALRGEIQPSMITTTITLPPWLTTIDRQDTEEICLSLVLKCRSRFR